MTRDETKEAAKIMLAWAGGAEIQVSLPGTKWGSLYGDPVWNWAECNYRIKPEPKRIWVNFYPDGDQILHTSLDDAQLLKNNRCLKTVEYVEVIKSDERNYRGK